MTELERDVKRVRLAIEWDSQSPEQDLAMLDEFHDLLEPWLVGYSFSWTATVPQAGANLGPESR